MYVKRLCLAVMVVLGFIGSQASGAFLAAYWDDNYPTNWAAEPAPTNVRDALEANGYEILDAAQLKTWMDARIADGASSVVIFCPDIAPDTVVETNTADCTLRKYLDAGGKIVFYADIPFWNQGNAGGGTTNWGAAGATGILGFNAAAATWDAGSTVTITDIGMEWGLTETWSSVRPTTVDLVDIVLATDSAGNAAAWVKHYVEGDSSHGFVRIQDAGGMPNVEDLMRLAEYGLGPNPLARRPAPKNGAIIDQTQAVLRWYAGDFAAVHNVYFGDSLEAVSAATPDDADLFLGTLATTLVPVGITEALVPGKTYYWRVDEVNDDEPDSPWTGTVWSFTVRPQIAWAPFPVDGMRNVDPNQDLSWDNGLGALFHTVYFGQSVEEVDTAPFGFMTAQPTYDPGPLELDTTYYWRVDEFAFPANATFKGDIWSFTTRGEGGGVKAEYFDGMALAGDPILTQIEPQIDHNWGSAEVAGGLADLVSARWRANLEVPVTETYRLIATSDDGVRLWLDGRLVIDDWVDRGTTDSTYSVDLVAGQYYMIQMEYYENGGGAVAQLSWQSDTLPRGIITQGWLQLPLRATSPSPAHLDPGANQAGILTWNGGDDATGHDVYFGDDADAVANADTTTTGIYRGRQAAGATSFNAGPLEWGKTYYWRVDEVNPDGVLTGALWSFTAADFLVVEDFESYDDDIDGGTAIFLTWIDGVDNGTGSYVGYEVAVNMTFGETTIVYGGHQAMPLEYDNSIAPFYSETSRTWTTPQNWTVNGVDTLTLYFRGKGDNDSEPLYVALEDSAGRIKVVVHPDPDAASSTSWTEWNIPLSDFAPVNAAAIKTMYIGLGNRNAPTLGGAGQIYVDDIRVTKAP